MNAKDLKKLADDYKARDVKVSKEVMTVLKNRANQGYYTASFREFAKNDWLALQHMGYSLVCNSDCIDAPYIVCWSKSE